MHRVLDMKQLPTAHTKLYCMAIQTARISERQSLNGCTHYQTFYDQRTEGSMTAVYFNQHREIHCSLNAHLFDIIAYTCKQR